MIMKLKMCTTGEKFVSVYLKAIRDISFQYVVCHQRQDGLRHEGKREDSIFWWGGPEYSPVPPLVTNPDFL